jgi:hypothetical protein
MPPELDAEIAAVAAEEGLSYSAWLASTARKEFTIRTRLAAVSEYEHDHSAFSADEIADAGVWAARRSNGPATQVNRPGGGAHDGCHI